MTNILRNITQINELKNIIRDNNGQKVYVEFRKKDDSLRKLTGVIDIPTDGGPDKSSVAHIPKYIVIKEDNVGFRNINLETLSVLKIGGKSYV